MEAEQREKLELLRLRGAVGRLRRELVEQQALAANVAATNGASVATQQKTEPQVNIRARFFTGTDEALEFIKDDATAIVAASEIRKLLTHLRESGNAELLAEQSVTTLSGRQAQVQSLEVRTNLSTGAVTESGYVVDVLPSVREDRNTVALTLVVSEYKDKPVITEGVQPLPIFTVRPMTANAVVWDGQTVVMATRSNGKKVVAIVTPTLINPAGNRVHPDAEL
jgi:type II secretory pathway component GspD/PulD (secretin)